MKTKLKVWTPWHLYSLHRQGEIDTNPDYQRRAGIWTRDRQQDLLYSILKGYAVPPLFFHRKGDRYAIVDGLQRLTVLRRFMDGELPLGKRNPDWKGLRYTDLPPDLRTDFNRYRLSVAVIEEATDAEVREMFQLHQNGVHLSLSERRHSLVGRVRDFVIRQTTHEFFRHVQFTDRRRQHETLAAQTLALEVYGGGQEPVSVGNTRLEAMYLEDPVLTEGVVAKYKAIYDVMCRIAQHHPFPEDTPAGRRKVGFLKPGMCVSLYHLLSRLWDDHELAGLEDGLHDWLAGFERRRQGEERDKPWMLKFSQRLQRGNDTAAAIAERHEVLLADFARHGPPLPLLAAAG